MDSLAAFSLPISGLRNGIHQFDFQIDKSFFEHFNESEFDNGNLKVALTFDKRPSFFVLDFHLEGTVRAACDRCLEHFDLPVGGSQSLKVKFDETEQEDAEVIYISRDRQELNVSKYIYELIHLSAPMTRTHDLAEEDCNAEFLKYLDGTYEDVGSSEESEDEEKKGGSVWDVLNDL